MSDNKKLSETYQDSGTDQDKDVADVTENPKKAKLPKEIGGRGGLEPTRYGDWENNGIISDF